MELDHVLRRDVCRLAEAAGREIARLYQRGDAEVRDKADGTPLTAADLASERLLSEGLVRWGWPILSEETKAAPFETRRGWPRFWLVDPLDGTREFVNRTGEFAVSVALVDQGRPVLGVIHAPMVATTWSALRGAGAYRSEADGDEMRLGPRELPPDRTALVSRSHQSGGRTARYLERLSVSVNHPSGSAIKFGRIAEGAAHLYVRLGPTMEWDVAAGDCICREQGLEVVSLPSGAPLEYNTRDLVNPPFIVRDPSDETLRSLPAPD